MDAMLAHAYAVSHSLSTQALKRREEKSNALQADRGIELYSICCLSFFSNASAMRRKEKRQRAIRTMESQVFCLSFIPAFDGEMKEREEKKKGSINETEYITAYGINES